LGCGLFVCSKYSFYYVVFLKMTEF